MSLLLFYRSDISTFLIVLISSTPYPSLFFLSLFVTPLLISAEAYTLLARIRRDADDASGDDESDAKSPMKQQDGGEADPEARDNNNNNNNADVCRVWGKHVLSW